MNFYRLCVITAPSFCKKKRKHKPPWLFEIFTAFIQGSRSERLLQSSATCSAERTIEHRSWGHSCSHRKCSTWLAALISRTFQLAKLFRKNALPLEIVLIAASPGSWLFEVWDLRSWTVLGRMIAPLLYAQFAWKIVVHTFFTQSKACACNILTIKSLRTKIQSQCVNCFDQESVNERIQMNLFFLD